MHWLTDMRRFDTLLTGRHAWVPRRLTVTLVLRCVMIGLPGTASMVGGLGG